MRVWLIEHGAAGVADSLAAQLHELARRPEAQLTLAGISGFSSEWQQALRSGSVDILVCRLDRGSEEIQLAQLLGTAIPVLLVLDAPLRQPQRLLTYLKIAAVLPSHAGPDGLWCGLSSLLAARQRETVLQDEAGRLQQRLADRLVIDKAKGVLMKRMGVDEEQAYKQLRVQSRRQRRPIREIAQALLDTHFLLPANGAIKKRESNTPPAAKDDTM
jgi:hypothetical protein